MHKEKGKTTKAKTIKLKEAKKASHINREKRMKVRCITCREDAALKRGKCPEMIQN